MSPPELPLIPWAQAHGTHYYHTMRRFKSSNWAVSNPWARGATKSAHDHCPGWHCYQNAKAMKDATVLHPDLPSIRPFDHHYGPHVAAVVGGLAG